MGIVVFAVASLTHQGFERINLVGAAFLYIFLLYRMINYFSDLYLDSARKTVELQGKYELEKQLQEEKARAFQNSKLASLGEMAAGIAHEIDNPLTMSLGKIKILESKLPEKDEKIKSLIESIEKSNERIADIVFSMRNLSRMGNDISKEVFNTSELQEIVNPITETKLKWFIVDLTWDIEACELKGSEGEVSQIIINLIQNAADAIEKLEDKWITVVGKEAGGTYFIEVKNSGPAISDEQI